MPLIFSSDLLVSADGPVLATPRERERGHGVAREAVVPVTILDGLCADRRVDLLDVRRGAVYERRARVDDRLHPAHADGGAVHVGGRI